MMGKKLVFHAVLNHFCARTQFKILNEKEKGFSYKEKRKNKA